MELDIDQLLVRFRRLERAVELGLEKLGPELAPPGIEAAGRDEDRRPVVRLALADAADEAVHLAEVALRLAAEADLWLLLGAVLDLWVRAGVVVESVAASRAPIRRKRAPVDLVARQLVELHEVELRLQAALTELAAHPSDRACNATVRVAISDLLRTGDALVPMGLAEPGTTRLDAVVAALQSVAARGGEAERRRCALRTAAGGLG